MSRIGLILEGGGMRGIFTAGVLDFFLDKNITFSDCFGVSAGSCHACSYLAGQRGRAYDVSVNYLNDSRYCSVRSFIKTGDIFGSEFVYHTVPKTLYPIDNEHFLKNPTNFYAVLTNCKTGKAEYHQIHDLFDDIDCIRGSSSLPALSRMVEINGSLYLDGGIADSIPLKEAVNRGITKNVVILTQTRSYKKEKNKMLPYIKIKYRKYPHLINSIEHRHENYNKTLEFISQQEKAGNIFVISPDETPDVRRIEKDEKKLKSLYDIGYKTAEKIFPSLSNFMTNLD